MPRCRAPLHPSPVSRSARKRDSATDRPWESWPVSSHWWRHDNFPVSSVDGSQSGVGCHGTARCWRGQMWLWVTHLLAISVCWYVSIVDPWGVRQTCSGLIYELFVRHGKKLAYLVEYLRIYWTDFYNLITIWKNFAGDRSVPRFPICQGTLLWQSTDFGNVMNADWYHFHSV